MHLPKTAQAPKGLLPKGSQLHGELSFAQGLRIEGQVWGNLRANDGEGATVVVAEGAAVVGSIEAAHVIVQGQVQGPIVATQHLQLLAGAQVDGELHYLTLDLHPDAVVRGMLVPILGGLDTQATAPTTATPEPSQGDTDVAKGPTDDEVKPEPTEVAEGEDVPSKPNP